MYHHILGVASSSIVVVVVVVVIVIVVIVVVIVAPVVLVVVVIVIIVVVILHSYFIAMFVDVGKNRPFLDQLPYSFVRSYQLTTAIISLYE